MNPSPSLQEKVETLREEIGELKGLLRTFVAVTDVDVSLALVSARRIAEHLVNAVLVQERLKAERDLLDNLETLGSKDAKPAARRGNRPPVLPPPIYSALHTLRIYGNLAVHPYEPGTGERKNVKVNSTDVQAALAQLLRAVEWYFADYERGPRLEPLYTGAPGARLRSVRGRASCWRSAARRVSSWRRRSGPPPSGSRTGRRAAPALPSSRPHRRRPT